ncbi:NAD(P)/FAD-dependent oxidoreductase [Fusibacter sp. 3D3]|uniref:NAD(P)/FAD-dependent oxidoreductase n=1 Tax=Fusibacter sp. 3D3 TaxID=1048380 RepID=UPI0008530243|nr:NAD(P)/FAD-dependent oxidoreductase [Fusibacter sp. 3D3]GAU76753.1 glycerol-3-phosphate dehydrogenase [Fusibacter sp. 3D3]
MECFKIAIIGAGVVGSAIARELSKFDIKTVLIEKEHDVSLGASKANSGIVHGGYAGKSGTLKGELCIRGNQMFEALNSALNFGYRRTGAYMLAFSERDFEVIQHQIQNGVKVGESGYALLDEKKLKERLPHVSDQAIGALYIPTVGVTSPYEFTIALAENAIENGVTLKLDFEVDKIHKDKTGCYEITATNSDTLLAEIIINVAGEHSDKIARLFGDESIKLLKRKGQYILFGKDQSYLTDQVIFQLPNDKGKGILVTTTYHGNLMIGPDAEDMRLDVNKDTSVESLEYVIQTARRSIPNINLKRALTTFSGVRSMSETGDFIIRPSEIEGLFHVAGIDSPGLTSSPAIAKYVVEMLKNAGVDLKDKTYFKADRAPLIKSQKQDSKMMCRCEGITEAEIRDCLSRGIPVDTTDAVKRRVRAGMGNCQGAYCRPRVKALLAEALDLPEAQIKTRTETHVAPTRVSIEVIRNLNV